MLIPFTPNGYALNVWESLRGEDFVKDAVQFYEQRNVSLDEVLKQGRADFDEKHTDEPYEKPSFRVGAYIWKYMDMHLRQNLAVLRKYLDDTKDLLEDSKHIVFVDFGCGPMTSGLALAEILLEHNKDYQERVTYLGIDASRNMIDCAKWINEQHEIFDPDMFKIVQDRKFHSEMMAMLPSSTNADFVILCMSFVLAESTLKVSQNQQEAWVRHFAHEWGQCVSGLQKLEEFRVVYINPKARHARVSLDRTFHETWRTLRDTLQTSDISGSFSYSDSGEEETSVKYLGNPVMSAQIRGQKASHLR